MADNPHTEIVLWRLRSACCNAEVLYRSYNREIYKGEEQDGDICAKCEKLCVVLDKDNQVVVL